MAKTWRPDYIGVRFGAVRLRRDAGLLQPRLRRAKQG